MADALAPAAVAVPDLRQRMSVWQQAALSLYWFGTSAHWTAIVITLLLLQAQMIDRICPLQSTVRNLQSAIRITR